MLDYEQQLLSEDFGDANLPSKRWLFMLRKSAKMVHKLNCKGSNFHHNVDGRCKVLLGRVYTKLLHFTYRSRERALAGVFFTALINFRGAWKVKVFAITGVPALYAIVFR